MILRKRGYISFRWVAGIVALAVFAGALCSFYLGRTTISYAHLVNQPLTASLLRLPPKLTAKPSESPVMKGLLYDATNPFNVQFYFDSGKSGIAEQDVHRLIRYFLGCLTVPQDKLWVNLSPFEKERIIPEVIAHLDIGKTLLLQDYLLKRITSQLTDPKTKTGKLFWDKVHRFAYEQAQTTNPSINTSYKIWIVPDTVELYEYDLPQQRGTQDEKHARVMTFVKKMRLKVLMEEDYLAATREYGYGSKNRSSRLVSDNTRQKRSIDQQIDHKAKEIFKKDLLPIIEKYVNSSEAFAPLRQFCHSLVLALYFKQKTKYHPYFRQYFDKEKVSPIVSSHFKNKELVYDAYLGVVNQGVYNHAVREFDPHRHQYIKRRYFSGGFVATPKQGFLSLILKKGSDPVTDQVLKPLSEVRKEDVSLISEPDTGAKDRGKNQNLITKRLLRDGVLRTPSQEQIQAWVDYIELYLYENDMHANDQEILTAKEVEILKKIRFVGDTYGADIDLCVLRYLFTRDKDTGALLIVNHLRDTLKNKGPPIGDGDGTAQHISDSYDAIIVERGGGFAQDVSQSGGLIPQEYFADEQLEVQALGHGYNRFAYSIYATPEAIEEEIPDFVVKVAQVESLKKKHQSNTGTKDEYIHYQMLKGFYKENEDRPYSRIYGAKMIDKRWVGASEYVQGKDLEKILKEWIEKISQKTLAPDDIGYMKLIVYEIGKNVGNFWAKTGSFWGDFKPSNIVVLDRSQFDGARFIVKDIDYEKLVANEGGKKRLAQKAQENNVTIPKRFSGIQASSAAMSISHFTASLRDMLFNPLGESFRAFEVDPAFIGNLFLAGFLEEVQRVRSSIDEQSVLKEIEQAFAIAAQEQRVSLSIDEQHLKVLKRLQKEREDIDFNNLASFAQGKDATYGGLWYVKLFEATTDINFFTNPERGLQPFRFPEYIWRIFKNNLITLDKTYPGIKDSIQRWGLAWTDPEGRTRWIDGQLRAAGYGSDVIFAVWEAARDAINKGNAQLSDAWKTGKRAVSSLEDVKRVVLYHEGLHRFFSGQLRQRTSFQETIYEYIGKIFTSSTDKDFFITAMTKVYGEPHNGERSSFDWFVGEFLVLSLQEDILFNSSEAFLQRLQEAGNLSVTLMNDLNLLIKTVRAAIPDDFFKSLESNIAIALHKEAAPDHDPLGGIDLRQQSFNGKVNSCIQPFTVDSFPVSSLAVGNHFEGFSYVVNKQGTLKGKDLLDTNLCPPVPLNNRHSQ